MTANKITLPLEMQELVISALYSSVYSQPTELLLDGTGDFQALNGCTLVSRAFLRVCRRLRFASLKINHVPAVPSQSSFKFVQIFEDPPEGLLEDIPSIGSCVRSLNFQITSFDVTHYQEELSTALLKITQLQSLALSYCGTDTASINWSVFEEETLGDAILHLLRLPTFRKLVLGQHMSKFPVSALRGTSIKALMVQGTSFSCYEDTDSDLSDAEEEEEETEKEETTESPKEGAPVYLEELHAISLRGHGLKALIHPKEDPWLNIDRLKTLTMMMHSSPESEGATKQVFSCMKSPDRLNLVLGQRKTFQGLFGYINSCLDTLGELRLTLSTNPFPLATAYTMEEQLSYLNVELKSLREAPVNNIKTLLVTFINLSTYIDNESLRTSKEWETLDDILVPSEDGRHWGSLTGIFFLLVGCGLGAEDFKKLSSCKQIKFQPHSATD